MSGLSLEISFCIGVFLSRGDVAIGGRLPTDTVTDKRMRAFYPFIRSCCMSTHHPLAVSPIRSSVFYPLAVPPLTHTPATLPPPNIFSIPPYPADTPQTDTCTPARCGRCLLKRSNHLNDSNRSKNSPRYKPPLVPTQKDLDLSDQMTLIEAISLRSRILPSEACIR